MAKWFREDIFMAVLWIVATGKSQRLVDEVVEGGEALAWVTWSQLSKYCDRRW